MATDTRKRGSSASDQGKKVERSTNNDHSRDKVKKVTKVAVKTYKEAMKELEKH